MNDKPLNPQDYLEPQCLLKAKPASGQPAEMIPQKRISEKVDELMGHKDFPAVERLLKYWMSEAQSYGDQHGRFFIFNEMMGFYRQTARQDKAIEAAVNGLEMIGELGYENSVSGATCYINAATVYSAFGQPEKAIGLFAKAKDIYEANYGQGEYKLGGLYNNMATAYSGLKQFDKAIEYYHKAIKTMKTVEQSQLEQAISWLNIVDCLMARESPLSLESQMEIDEYLTTASQLIDSPELPRDSYYGYVCERCVDIYEYFGWFGYVKQLKERIANIYEGA